MVDGKSRNDLVVNFRQNIDNIKITSWHARYDTMYKQRDEDGNMVQSQNI